MRGVCASFLSLVFVVLSFPPQEGAAASLFGLGGGSSEARLYTVCLDGRCGYADGAGTFVIPPRFEAANPFVEGRAWVREGGLIGAIDAQGEWAIPPRFKRVSDFAANGLAGAQNEDGKWGAIDAQGEWAIPPRFNDVGALAANGLAQAKNEDGKWGFINAKGEWAIPPRFKLVGAFAANGFAWVQDEDGKVWEFAGNGFAWARNEDGKWGWINVKGKWAIPPRFTHVSVYAIFDANGLVSLWDEDGKEIHIDRNAVPRLEVGFDQKAETCRWEFGKAQDTLRDGEGRRILIRSTLCGVEVAKSAAGDLLWPRKTEAQICEDSLARRRWEKETGRDAERP